MKNIFSLAIVLIAFPANSAARGCYIKYCPNPPSDTSLDSFCPKYKQFVICWEREIVVCDEYDVTELSRFYFKVGKESYLEQCEPRKVETTTTTTTSTSTTTSKPKPKHCNKPQCGKNNRNGAQDCETRLRHLKCLEPYYNKCESITDDEFALFYLQKEETERDCQNDKDSVLTTTRKTTTSTTTRPPTTTSTTTKSPTTTTKTTTSTTTKPPTTTTTTSTTTTFPTTTSTTSTTTTTPITSTSQAKPTTTTTVKSTTAKRTTTSTVPVTSQPKTTTTSHKSSKCIIPECSVPKEPLTDVSQCQLPRVVMDKNREYKEYRRCMSPYYEECDTLSENLKKIYFEEQLYTDEFCSQNEDKLCPVNFETKLYECQSKLDFGIFALFKLAGELVDDYRDNVDIDFDFEKVSAECMDGTYTSALTCSENLMTRCAGNPAMSYIEKFIDISKQKVSIEKICSRREELDENMGCLQAQAEKSASFYESVIQRMNTEIRNHRQGGQNNIKWIIDTVCEYTKEATFYTNHFFQSCGTNAEAMATSILHADIPRVCAVEFTGSAMRIGLSLPLLLTSLLIMMFRH